MATAFTTAQLEQLRSNINSGDLSSFYSYMASQGYKYAILANGLVTGSSFSGEAAINYLKAAAISQGVDFNDEKTVALEYEMANAWVSALEAVAGPNGTVSGDLSYVQTLDFHTAVFNEFGLPGSAWTLYTPGQVLDSQTMESDWRGMLAQMTPSSSEPFSSETALFGQMLRATEGANPGASWNWIFDNVKNLPSDLVNIFKNSFATTVESGPDGATQYTDSNGVTLFEYKYNILDPNSGGTFTFTEDVWDIPVPTPTITVSSLDGNVTVSASSSANLSVAPSGKLNASGASLLISNSPNQPLLSIDGSNNDIKLAAGAQVAISGVGNSIFLSSGASFSITGQEASNNLTGWSDTNGNTSISFSGGSVLLGPVGEITQLADGALNLPVGPGGNAPLYLTGGSTAIDFEGLESLTLSVDSGVSLIDQSGNSYRLVQPSDNQSFTLTNSSGSLNVSIDPSALSNVSLGENVSFTTSSGATFSQPLWGGAGYVTTSNLGNVSIASGASISIGSNDITVSEPATGTTQVYGMSTTGAVSSIATYNDSSAQQAPQSIKYYNALGDQTQLLTNNGNGTSQLVSFNPNDPASNYLTQVQTYSGANASGLLLTQTTDFTNGLSEVDVYQPSAGVLSVRTVYSDLDGTGSTLSQTVNNSNGTSTVTTFATADTPDADGLSQSGVTAVTTTYSGLDGTGSITSTNYAMATQQTISDSTIGDVLGSQIGRILGGNSIVASVGLSSVLGEVGRDAGAIIDAGAGDISQTVDQIASSALPDIATSGAGAIGAYLTAEFVKELGIGGLPGQIVDTGAGFVVATISSNLAAEAAGANVAWNAGIGLSSIGGAFGGFMGTELASLVVTWSTPAEADLAAIGSAIGSVVGGAFGPVGSFIGGFVGDLVGGLLGSFLGHKQTPDPSAYGHLSVSGSYASPYSWSFDGQQDNGPVTFVNAVGSAMATELNAIAAEIGGTITNASDLSKNFFGFDSLGTLPNLSVVAPGLSGSSYSAADKSDPSSAVDAMVFGQLSAMQVSGGDVYVERAIAATIEERNSIGESINLEALFGNIAIAKDYEKYLENEATINGLIAHNPTSNFALGWILELQQAASLNLANGETKPLVPSEYNTLNLYANTVRNQSASQIEHLIEKNPYASISPGVTLSASSLSLSLNISGMELLENGPNNRLTVNGSNNSVTMSGSGDIFIESGSNNVIVEDGNSDALAMYGDNNVMTVNGAYASVVVSGTNDVLTNANGRVTVADSSHVTVNGMSESISMWNGSVLTVNGGQMNVSVGGSGNGLTVNGDDAEILLSGDSNTFQGNGQGDEVTVVGTNETVTIGSGSVSISDGNTVAVNGENAGITIGSGVSLTVGGQNMGVTVSGDGDKVTLNGTSLGISGAGDAGNFIMNGSNDSISISGSHNQLTGNGDHNYLTVAGSENSLVANGQQVTATLAGVDNSVTIGNGSVYVQNGGSGTVNGFADAVTIYNQTTLSVNGGSMNFTINGGGDTATLNGDDQNVSLSGSGDVLTNNGAYVTANVNGDANSVTENGDHEWVTVNGNYDAVGGHMNSTTATINGSGSSLTAVGNNNLLTENGTDSYFTVTGSGNQLNANGPRITAAISGTSNSVSIGYGTASFSDNASGTVNGVSDQVNVRNTSQILVNGGQMSVAINGSQDTVTANGNASNFDVEGSSNLFTANGGNESFRSNGNYNNVTLNGDSQNVYVNGVDNVVSVNGQGNVVTFAGQNNTLHAGGATAYVLDGSSADFEGGGNAITVYNNDVVTINGSGFSVVETATASSVTGNGDYNTATLGGNHNALSFNGNTDMVVVSGSANTVTVSGALSTIRASGVQQSVSANEGDVELADGSQLSLVGNGNAVTLGKSDSLTVNGSNNWVSAGQDSQVTLNGNGNGVGSNATGLSVLMQGNGQYGYLSDSVVSVGGGVSVSIYGDGDSITAGVESAMFVKGAGNSIHMSGGTLNLGDQQVASGNDPETGGSNSGFAVNGFDYTSYNAGQFASSTGAQSMAALAETGANSVSLVVTQYVQSVYDTNIQRTDATESDASLEVAISEAKADGLSVTLKPHLDVADGTWRAFLDPSNIGQFFANYQAMILHYAVIAQATGAGTLVIGTEMESLSGEAYKPYWDSLIAAVRQVYSGQLTYASGWNETGTVSFWDKVDAIGADAYIPVTTLTDPTLQQLQNGWVTKSPNSYDASVMGNMAPVDFYKSLSVEYNKPVLFTEIGYQSINDTNELEGAFGLSNWVDYQQQDRALQAFFDVFSQNGGNWFEGAYLWNWEANPAGVQAGDFSVQGKPGTNIVDYWYAQKNQSSSGAAPASLSGDNNNVSVGNGDALDLSGSFNTVSLGTNAGVSVSGQNNKVLLTGGNDLVQTSSSTEIDVTGAHTAAIVSGDDENIIVSGANDGIAVTTNGSSISLLAASASLTLSGNDSTVKVSASNATISTAGQGNVFAVSASNANLQTEGANTVLLTNGAASASVQGDDDTIMIGTAAGAGSNQSSVTIETMTTTTPLGDSLVFTGANSDQLWFARTGDDLIVSVLGTSSEIDAAGWFSSNAGAVRLIRAADGKELSGDALNAMVTAMASFSAPSLGATTLPDLYRDQLQPTITANWH